METPRLTNSSEYSGENTGEINLLVLVERKNQYSGYCFSYM